MRTPGGASVHVLTSIWAPIPASFRSRRRAAARASPPRARHFEFGPAWLDRRRIIGMQHRRPAMGPAGRNLSKATLAAGTAAPANLLSLSMALVRSQPLDMAAAGQDAGGLRPPLRGGSAVR